MTVIFVYGGNMTMACLSAKAMVNILHTDDHPTSQRVQKITQQKRKEKQEKEEKIKKKKKKERK